MSKRKTLLVSKDFQIRFIALIALLSIIFALVVGTITYIFIAQSPTKNFLGKLFKVSTQEKIFIAAMTLSSVLALIIIIIIGLFISHKIAGPLYRITKYMHRLADGDLSFEVKLRKNDEFADLAEEFDKTVKRLRMRMEVLLEIVKDMDKKYNELLNALKKDDKKLIEKGLEELSGHVKVLDEAVSIFKLEP